MARLEGTGKDPLGRYGKGEVIDVPKFLSTYDAERGNVNPAYQELVDNGYATVVAPEDDPARTVTQIAAAKIGASGGGVLQDPVDQAIAEGIDQADAYAITHTGDPAARASEDDGDVTLKPDRVRETQADDPQQVAPTPGAMASRTEQAEDPEDPGRERVETKVEGKGDGESRVGSERTASNASGGTSGKSAAPKV